MIGAGLWSWPVAALLAAVVAFADGAAQFPAPLVKCLVANETCLVEQANRFFRSFPGGVPERGLAPLDPLLVPSIDIVGYKKSSAHLDLFLTDVSFHNYSNVLIKGMKVLLEEPTVKMLIKSHHERITIKANYRADGQVLLLAIKSAGELVWSLSGVQSRTRILLEREQRSDGEVYLRIVDYEVQAKIENLQIQMTNLFNGDKALSEQLVRTLNENWRLLGDDVVGHITGALAKAHMADLNVFLKDIPLREYFLPQANATANALNS